jgi:hypothetical protein
MPGVGISSARYVAARLITLTDVPEEMSSASTDSGVARRAGLIFLIQDVHQHADRVEAHLGHYGGLAHLPLLRPTSAYTEGEVC